MRSGCVCVCVGIVLAVMGFFPSGCQRVSSTEELTAFHQSGPPRDRVGVETLSFPDREPEPYHVVPGDLLELEMPDVMGTINEAFLPEEQRKSTALQKVFTCRLDKDGRIDVPILGKVDVTDTTLPEIENVLADRYWPKYLRRRPSIVVRVSEYKTFPIAVVGGVKKPGAYELRSDEMTLIAALGKAEGIVETGAESIQLHRGASQKEPIVVKVVHQTIPTSDPSLRPGDKIVVQSCEMPSFTVIGLVKKPGKFPYPPSETYNVMQAIAHAGGLNEIARPEYVKVYRKNQDGALAFVTLKTGGEAAVSASNVVIKPGDVVAIEQTAATYMRLFFSQILNVGVSAGASVGP